MSFLKNRLFIGAICIVFAVLIGFFAVPLMVSITNEKMEVVAARTDIPKGAEITEDMIGVVEMFASDIPPGAGLVPEDIIGTYATTSITQNDILFTGKFSANFPYDDEALYVLPVGKYAVAVTTSTLSSSVAGKIKPGDIVTVLVNTSTETTQIDLTADAYPELMYLRVLGVTTQEGSNIMGDLQADEDKNVPIPSVVTLMCNLEQAMMLAGFEAHAQIHLALVARQNSERAEEYLERQEERFA